MPLGVEFIDKEVDIGEIIIYGDICNDQTIDTDMTPKIFKSEYDKIKNKNRINVHINSNGGGISAGNAICNILLMSKAETFGYVDGIAASIASVIFQSCKHRIVYENSLIFIHDPIVLVIAYMSAADCYKLAKDLEINKETIVPMYAKRTKISEEKVRKLMAEETLMIGQEAIDLGFADTMEKGNDFKNILDGNKFITNGQAFNTSIFKTFPKDRFVASAIPVIPEPVAIPVNTRLANARERLFNLRKENLV
jgi:ATP-dependent Clp protease, protease subunit